MALAASRSALRTARVRRCESADWISSQTSRRVPRDAIVGVERLGQLFATDRRVPAVVGHRLDHDVVAHAVASPWHLYGHESADMAAGFCAQHVLSRNGKGAKCRPDFVPAGRLAA